MAKTYRELTNELLRELNEVPLTSSEFDDAIGIQGMVKDKVNLAYMDIVNEEPRWPFLAVAESGVVDPFFGNISQETVAGQRWYEINPNSDSSQDDYTAVDWQSFYLTTIGVAGESAPYVSRTLHFATIAEWQRFQRDSENQDDADTQQWGEPTHVIRSFDNRHFGLSPIPKKVYAVKYFGYQQPTPLSSESDELPFPDIYTTVLLARARYYIWYFKHNYEAAAQANEAYKRGLRAMRENLLGATQKDFQDDRVYYV